MRAVVGVGGVRKRRPDGYGCEKGGGVCVSEWGAKMERERRRGVSWRWEG